MPRANRHYVDLNRVRTGAVNHPLEWPHSGYREIQRPPKRYAIIDVGALSSLFGLYNSLAPWPHPGSATASFTTAASVTLRYVEFHILRVKFDTPNSPIPGQRCVTSSARLTQRSVSTLFS